MALSPIAKLAIFLGVGAVLFIFGLSFGLVVRGTIDKGLKDVATVCSKDDDSYDGWRTNTGDEDAKKYKMYYGFNATNAAEYLSQTATAPVDLEVNMVGRYAMRQLDTYYNVTFTNDDAEVHYKTWTKYTFDKEASCEECSRTDLFTNMNPVLLIALTLARSETIAALGVSSVNIKYLAQGYPQCTQANIAHTLGSLMANPPGCDPKTDTQCCCNPAVADPSDFSSCSARASDLWSTFSKFDGGVKLLSGEDRYSPLFLTKNVHEAAFGYPSALGGLLQALPMSGNATLLADMAAYTELVVDACDASPAGNAPAPEDMPEGAPYAHMGLITCAPLQGSLYWAMPIDENGTRLCEKYADNSAACLCVADMTRTTTTERPCCTISGFGCLAKVTGYVSDEQYLTQDQAYLDYSIDGTRQNTGCGEYEEGMEFSWTEYESVPERPAWNMFNRTLYDMPTQTEVATIFGNPAIYAESWRAPVSGGDGTRMKGTGKTSGMFSNKLSDGTPKYDKIQVFVTQVYRSTYVHAVGDEDYHGVTVVRYDVDKTLTSQGSMADPPGDLDNGEVGAGTPFSGVQNCFMFYRFPVFVSQPLFLNGDTTYLSDHGVVVKVNGEPAEPDEETYGTYLLVEPASGMTISGHKRLMASFALYRCDSPSTQACVEGFGLASLMTPFVKGDVVVPQYYMDETSDATDKQLSDIKTVGSLSLAADVVLLVFPILGGAFWAIGAFTYITARKTGRSTIGKASLMSDRD